MYPLLYTSQANIYEPGRQPYGADYPVSGDDYMVFTDRHNPVIAWVAYNGHVDQQLSWCHGFALGTYERWGYSVYSGAHVGQVLRDEYRIIAATEARSGDIIAWRRPATRDYPHTAILRNVVLNGNVLNRDLSTIDSKDGTAQILRNIAISSIPARYGTDINILRSIRSISI